MYAVAVLRNQRKGIFRGKKKKLGKTKLLLCPPTTLPNSEPGVLPTPQTFKLVTAQYCPFFIFVKLYAWSLPTSSSMAFKVAFLTPVFTFLEF